ncbi:putative GPI-anchored protein [Apostasia shenzhenica]|uniref:Putative GPI-anchored protein n=1 Tax=Apostasia shenzhenica TaxID=1088818 RepID=A0A2H9ZQW4_9ASPA|nr:putative GPI-anchored protein [Apostasia shenzhenica]
MRRIIAASFLLLLAAGAVRTASHGVYSNQQQPLEDSSTVPAFPVAGGAANRSASASCQLDLSSEMFGGVDDACGRGAGGSLDRSRCCPVLAAWLFAAHARSALQFRRASTPAPSSDQDPLPMMPETESQRCADALQISLAARDIRLPRPNATCDAALCFCGIRLHEIGSLSCPAAFNLSAATAGAGGMAKPTAAVRALERDCRNASYAGCTRCLNSLEKLKGFGGQGGGERVQKMMERDCRLMGLTWLLARNKTAYIPTVSAVLRAILYSAHPPTPPYRCSPDQENMPLAVDSFQFERASSGLPSLGSRFAPAFSFYSLLALSVAGHVG